jgi:hypothetical protein
MVGHIVGTVHGGGTHGSRDKVIVCMVMGHMAVRHMVMGQRVLGYLVVRPVSVVPRDSGKKIGWAVDV